MREAISIQLDRYALTEEDKIKILDGSLLEDGHIDLFHNIMRTNSPYKPQSTLIVQRIVRNPQLQHIQRIDRNERHLQLLHSCDGICPNCLSGHWICCYYDTTSIFIFDSFNNGRLHYKNELFLRQLFPFFDEVPKHFKKVQYQNNAHDCGVFAIAFATSICFQQNPSKIIYDVDKMRPHLYDMFERNTLIYFPTLENESPKNHLLSLGAIVLNQKKVSILKKAVYKKSNILSNEVIAIGENCSLTPITSTSKKFPSEANNHKELRSLWSISGLPNPDIQCYANASLQTLLHCTCIRQKLFENPEQNALYFALQEYVSGGQVNVMALRGFAHKQYIKKEQQDAAEFITHLCNKSDNLNAVLKHELIVERRCPTCKNTRIDEPTNNYILTLTLPNCNDVTLQDIINFNIDKWSCTGIHCSNGCQTDKEEKTSLRTNNKTLMLQFKLFIANSNRTVRKINNLNIKNLDQEIVIINKKRYKVISGVFHHGYTMQSGHYTCMLRENDYWLRVNDLNVCRFSWPENSKDVYLIFLEEVSELALPQSSLQNNLIGLNKFMSSDENDYQRPVQQSDNNKIHTNKFIADKLFANNFISNARSNQQNKSFLNNNFTTVPVIIDLSESHNSLHNNNKHSKYYESHKAEILLKRKLHYNKKKNNSKKVKLNESMKNVDEKQRPDSIHIIPHSHLEPESVDCLKKLINGKVNISLENNSGIENIDIKFVDDCAERNLCYLSNGNMSNSMETITKTTTDMPNNMETVTESTLTAETTVNSVVSEYENKKRNRKIDTQYYNSHKTMISKKCKSYYKTHKAKILEKRKVYYKTNQRKLKEQVSNSKKKAYNLEKNKFLENSRNYYEQNKKQICAKRKVYFDLKKRYCNLNKEQNLIKAKKTVAKKIKKKYKVILKQDTNKLLQNKEKFIRNVMEKLDPVSTEEDRREEAKSLVSTAIYVRSTYISRLKRVLQSCKNKVSISLTRLGIMPIHENERAALIALCGFPKHCSTTEPYFSEAAYGFQKGRCTENIEDSNVIILNEKGQSTNIFPLIDSTKNNKTWNCNNYCKVVDADILKDLRQLFDDLLYFTYVDANSYLMLDRYMLC